MLTAMHNGTIELHSSGIEGEGSIFNVKLPVIKPPLAESLFSIHDGQVRDQSILVLTSQANTTPGIFNNLKSRGGIIHQALLADTGNWQAILGSVSPDLIIIDVTNQSGLDWRALRTIKENDQTRDIPTLLYASAENKGSLLRFDYLTKPVDVDDFTRALDQYWDSTILDHQSRKILVVDDDPNTLDLYARIVQSHSPINKVRLASNGEQAMQILQKESIDLVLLDLQMPKMDGFSVLNAMRNDKRTSRIPVIIITGTILTKEDMDRLNQGVSVILQKGIFDMSETIQHIEATLQNKQKLSTETQYLVRQAMAFIHDNYNRPLSREDIAQHVNVSKDYLTYCFRQELKTTPIRYIQRYRINLAKPILKNSQKSITEIAMEVGFNDSGYFSRLFHREVGISPDQFRQL
jgi:AraC-like DNA-binding protein